MRNGPVVSARPTDGERKLRREERGRYKRNGKIFRFSEVRAHARAFSYCDQILLALALSFRRRRVRHVANYQNAVSSTLNILMTFHGIDDGYGCTETCLLFYIRQQEVKENQGLPPIFHAIIVILRKIKVSDVTR